MKVRFAEGAHYGAYAQLGYRKDPDKKGKLLIDEDSRWIIEKIFDLASHGMGAAKITKTLIEEKVPTSAWLNFQKYGTFAHIFEGQPESKRYLWTIGQVKSLMKDETYIGNSVHNKQSTVSFKSWKKIRKPEEEWYRVENTHEPLVDKDVFRQVQEQIMGRRRERKDKTTQIFAGLVKCADCGWSLRFGTNNQNKTPYSHFSCSYYGQFGKGYCSAHYIRYDMLYAYVLSRLQYWSQEAEQDEGNLLHRLLKTGDRELAAAKKKAASELKKKQRNGNGIFAATPTERITHYTLLRKVVCKKGRCPLLIPPQETAIHYPFTRRVPPFLVISPPGCIATGVVVSYP
jgi:site-specific DNA recombinase